MNRALTDDEKQIAVEAILRRMGETPTFTFADCYTAGDRAVGWEGTYRLADKLLQRERKAGHIRQKARAIWEKVQ